MIGFKEWSVVCDALGNGRQSLILRKGGIHEGRRGFQFDHPEFALFPTRFHEQETHIRQEELATLRFEAKHEFEVGDQVEICFLARLEATWTVTDWSAVVALQDMHIWDEQTIRDRYECALKDGDPAAINVAFVRVSAITPAWEFPYARRYGGCRSWIELPTLPGSVQRADVLDSQESSERLQCARELLGEPLSFGAPPLV